MTAAAHAALLMLSAGARAEWIDFAQLDVSPSATTVVLVSALGAADAARPAPVLSATYTRWSTGEAAGAGLVYRWAVPLQTQHWLVGAGVGANANRSWAPGDEQNDAALAACGPIGMFRIRWLTARTTRWRRSSSYRGTWLATAVPSSPPAGRGRMDALPRTRLPVDQRRLSLRRTRVTALVRAPGLWRRRRPGRTSVGLATLFCRPGVRCRCATPFEEDRLAAASPARSPPP